METINDYSEVTAGLQARIVKLSDLLESRNYVEALSATGVIMFSLLQLSKWIRAKQLENDVKA
tara:strand:+ start:924 stop:1112 length:189 start_codon:yes stop_codon:yes gene_type:complete